MTEEQELELFAIRSKFFREIPHPKLILKAMNQVQQLADLPITPVEQVIVNTPGLEAFLQQHSDQTYALKLAISNAEKPEKLYQALDQLYQWYQLLFERLTAYLPDRPSFPDESIKQSDPVDCYRILQFIRSEALAENQISTYICVEIDKGLCRDFSILTKACLQARKIHTNDGSHKAS